MSKVSNSVDEFQIRDIVVGQLGGVTKTARKLTQLCKDKKINRRISRQAVFSWRRIPLFWVPYIEELLDYKYTRNQLRPDIY